MNSPKFADRSESITVQETVQLGNAIFTVTASDEDARVRRDDSLPTTL